MTDTQTSTNGASNRSALEKRRENIAKLNGSFASVEEANKRLSYAVEVGHLLSPVPQFSQLPDGLALALSVTMIQRDVDTFKPGGGKNALLKPALLKIAEGLGIQWDTDRCYVRMVQGKAFVAEAYAEGEYVDPLSLTKSKCFGTVLIDLSDDSPECPQSPKERDQKRKFLVRDAESKAINRAIRMAAKLRPAYTDEELTKPFVAVRVIEVRPRDPELAREYDREVLRRFRQSTTALYGNRERDVSRSYQHRETAPALPDAATVQRISMNVDYDEDTGEVHRHVPAAARDATPKREPAKKPASHSSGGSSGGTIKFGRAKGQKFSEAGEDDLTWYLGVLRKDLDNPEKERFRSANESDIEQIEACLARLRGEDGGDCEPVEDKADDDARFSGSPDDY